MRRHLRRYWHLHAALLIALGLLVALLAGVFAGSSSQWHVFKVRGQHGGQVPLTVPAAAVKQAATSNLAGHKDARDETPPGAPAKVIRAAKKQQATFSRLDRLPRNFPLSAPSQRGCRTELVQDFSSRYGVKPRIFVLHYTVSPNRAGWSDVNSVVALFNTWAFQASSNYVIDGEGNCAYIVREVDKAWTQAALNPDSISVEVINTGHEPLYAAAAGLAKIGLVVSDATCRWKIPLQQGLVVGGLVKRHGIVDHSSLGVAGGGHHDITPYAVPQVIAAVKAARAKYGCGHRAPKPKPAPKTAAAVIRAKTGYWSWLAWRLGQAAWKGYGHANPTVRPHVPQVIPRAWWQALAAHNNAVKGAHP